MTGRIQRRKSALPKGASSPIKGSDLAKTGQRQRQIEDDDRTKTDRRRRQNKDGSKKAELKLCLLLHNSDFFDVTSSALVLNTFEIFPQVQDGVVFFEVQVGFGKDSLSE